METYNKPFLSLPEQLAVLKSRGLLVEDESAAIECLHRNGYYRLSAYWFPFREIVDGKRTDTFLRESRFEDARELYVFDKKFKLLLLDAIERVEIATRVEIALCLGVRDPFAHTKPAYFRPSFTASVSDEDSKHQIWLEKFKTAVESSKDTFVSHHQSKYGEDALIPLWIAIELWDFGMLSKFYSGMLTPDCVCVANRFSIPHWHVMRGWLHTLNYVRNVIAHHGRLWNLYISVPPKSPAEGLMPDFDLVFSRHDANKHVYAICCILAHFSKVVNPQSSWRQQLIDLIDEFPVMPHAHISNMGFPDDWRNHSFWK